MYMHTPVQSRKKRRVCGYARVSTDHEDQQSSYEAQLDYYTAYIQSRDDWEFAGMYSDEGITGTSTKYRDGFKQMISDALDGKVDLIITKSVSRFARNTVDSLSTIRKLKEKGVEIYFEKENIWTFDAKGELLITIMSSLAQEESRSISENTTWGRRKQFADGFSTVAFPRFLGYDRGEHKGEYVINESQAETVREIYRLFLSGLSLCAICKELEAQGRTTATGSKKWCTGSVQSILTNEKYKGDALLQKCYTADFLTKKQVKNNGEVPQYYVEGHHEAIVTKEQFDEVQLEFERRKKLGVRFSGAGIFSSRIVCGDCGGFYGSKVWHSNDKYRKVIWRCNHKYGDGEKCKTPTLSEQDIQGYFMRAINILYKDRDEYIANMELLLEGMEGSEALTAKYDIANAELKTIEQEIRESGGECSLTGSEGEITDHYGRLLKAYEDKRKEAEDLDRKRIKAKAAEDAIGLLIDTLRDMTFRNTAFDERLWGGLVETMEVHPGGDVVFHFKGGIDVTVD